MWVQERRKKRRMEARSGGWQRWIRFISRWEALAFPASDDLLGYNVVTHDLSLLTRRLATTPYLVHNHVCASRTCLVPVHFLASERTQGDDGSTMVDESEC